MLHVTMSFFCSYLQGILNDDRSMTLHEVAKQLRGRGFVAWQHRSNVLLFLSERFKDWISTTHVIYSSDIKSWNFPPWVRTLMESHGHSISLAAHITSFVNMLLDV